MLLYVHRDYRDYYGLGAQDGHLDFDTALELWCGCGRRTTSEGKVTSYQNGNLRARPTGTKSVSRQLCAPKALCAQFVKRRHALMTDAPPAPTSLGTYKLLSLASFLVRQPVWPSGKALGW